MDKYIEAEKKLAELLGWSKVKIGGAVDGSNVPNMWLSGVPSGGTERVLIPLWTRDNAAAFALMVEHFCYPNEHEFGIECNGITADVSNHPTKESAVRYAIVMAVIAKLEAQNV